MARISAFILVTLISAADFGSAAQALQIEQFDKMAQPDQKEYVMDLVSGAMDVLRAAGRVDQAEEVARLFTTKDPQGKISIGMSQFMISLAKGRVADLKRLEKDPNATRIEVEHAMILVLKHDGIELPKSFMHVADKFRPQLPTKK